MYLEVFNFFVQLEVYSRYLPKIASYPHNFQSVLIKGQDAMFSKINIIHDSLVRFVRLVPPPPRQRPIWDIIIII